uniref:Doublesex dimerisation domain-containing protein n=1 Tax=Anopheles dirus TaxID=7168 RepID=A0A182NG40_9DIPT
MMPLMYVILKSADGDVQKAHQRIDEGKRTIKTYEDLLKSSLDPTSDRLTEDDEDENISVTRTNSTIRSRSSSLSRSRSCSRQAETPHADDRALNLDTKFKSSNSSSDRDDVDGNAFDDSASVVRAHGRAVSAAASRGRSQAKKFSHSVEDIRAQSGSPVPGEEPSVYDSLVEVASKKSRRFSPTREAEDLHTAQHQKSPEREDLPSQQPYEAYLESIRRSKKASFTLKDNSPGVGAVDPAEAECYEKEKEPRIPYSLPSSTFDRLELLKKPNGLSFPMYKYNGIETNNFALPLLIPGLDRASRTLYSTPFPTQLLSSSLYPSVSSDSTTVPMFHTHFLGYQPPLQLPHVEHFYRKEHQQQQQQQQQQLQQHQQQQAALVEPKEPASSSSPSNNRSTPPKGVFFYANAVENSLSAHQASIATIH